jgi:hypothetical protein
MSAWHTQSRLARTGENEVTRPRGSGNFAMLSGEVRVFAEVQIEVGPNSVLALTLERF